MDVKLVVVIVVLLTLAGDEVDAGLLYDQFPSNETEANALGLICVPGHTIIKVTSNKNETQQGSPDSIEDMRRTHMNSHIKNENCQICVCSVEGKDEYCVDRPARNVNECIRLAIFKKERESNKPFPLDRILPYRIRRDYIWHYDEIPYDSKAACRRGTSYYTNSKFAANTTIDVDSDIESLLDYANNDTCFYCVCNVQGSEVGCINRSPWYCEYYKILRQPQTIRDMYRGLLQQDRPAYFRTLSYRLRRRMDVGIYDLMDVGGDTLCCNHPDGHRRNLHQQIRNKIRQMRRKVPKENMMTNSHRDDYVDFIVNND